MSLLALGTRVYVSHRASSCDGLQLRDITNRLEQQRAWRLLLCDPEAKASHNGKMRIQPPLRVGMLNPLGRWVVAWPAPGYGVVCGLTHRGEGRTEPGGVVSGSGWDQMEPEYQQPYFCERKRFPLYVVKRNLRERGLLVPPWAITVVTPDMIEMFGDQPPICGPERREAILRLPHGGVAFPDYASSLGEALAPA